MKEYKDVAIKYRGTFKNNGNEYVVAEDVITNLVLVYFNSIEYDDVECYQFCKSYVNSFKGKDIVNKMKNCWRDLMTRNEYYIESHCFLQTFRKGFWEDIVVPMMNGEELKCKVQIMEVDSND